VWSDQNVPGETAKDRWMEQSALVDCGRFAEAIARADTAVINARPPPEDGLQLSITLPS
jgi:hypothetical protein